MRRVTSSTSRDHTRGLLQTPVDKFEESAAELINRVDKRPELQAADTGKKWLKDHLPANIADVSPEFLNKINDFVSGYVERAKAEFENTKYSNRVWLAIASVVIFFDATTDWNSAYLLSFRQAVGISHGQGLFAVLALHKMIELFFIYFMVYGTFHVDLVYSLFQVKGIVGASRVISNEKQAEDARLDPVSVLFCLMINDMCIESTPQVRICGRTP